MESVKIIILVIRNWSRIMDISALILLPICINHNHETNLIKLRKNIMRVIILNLKFYFYSQNFNVNTSLEIYMIKIPFYYLSYQKSKNERVKKLEALVLKKIYIKDEFIK